MAADLNNAAAITPPISGSDDLLVLATSGTAGRFRIPAGWLRSWLTVEIEGSTGFCAFTLDNTLVLDGTDVTTLDGSYDISAHGTAEGVYLGDGIAKSFDLSKLPPLTGGESWYLAHVEADANGYIRIRRSSGFAQDA